MYYGYARISTEQQNDASLEVQVEYLRKCAQKLGDAFHPVTEKASGKNVEDRPILQRLLKTVKEGDYVGVYDNSRLGRNTEDNLKVAKDLKSKGVFLQINGKIVDLNDPQELLLLTMESSISTYFRDLQLDKIRKGIDIKHRNGDWIYPDTLIGYNSIKKSGKNIVTVNEEEASLVKYIFNRYSNSIPLIRIAEEVALVRNYSTASATMTIKNILKNPIYMGYYKYEGILIKSNYYEPIITEEEYWLCQTRLQAASYKNTRTATGLASGVFTCPSCGNHLYAFHEKQYIQNHKRGCNNPVNVTIVSSLIDTILAVSYYITFSSGDDLEAFCREQRENILLTKAELQEQLKELRDSLSDIDADAEKLVTMMIKTSFTEVFQKKLDDLEKQKKNTQIRIKEIEQAYVEQSGLEEDLYMVTSENMLERFGRASLLETIKHAYILEDKSIDILYKSGRRFKITGYPMKVYKGEKHFKLTMESGCGTTDHWILFSYDENRVGKSYESTIKIEWIDQPSSDEFGDYVNELGRKKVSEICTNYITDKALLTC